MDAFIRLAARLAGWNLPDAALSRAPLRAAAMHLDGRQRQTGFTVLELVIVMIVVGILGGYAAMRTGSSAAFSLISQANTMAKDIRHVQSLAHTWDRPLRITITAAANGTYSVSCVTSGTKPCNASPVIDPATGHALLVAVQKGVVLAGTASVDFDSSGKPSAAASYTLTSGSATKTVAIAALTGLVTVSP